MPGSRHCRVVLLDLVRWLRPCRRTGIGAAIARLSWSVICQASAGTGLGHAGKCPDCAPDYDCSQYREGSNAACARTPDTAGPARTDGARASLTVITAERKNVTWYCARSLPGLAAAMSGLTESSPSGR